MVTNYIFFAFWINNKEEFKMCQFSTKQEAHEWLAKAHENASNENSKIIKESIINVNEKSLYIEG